MNRLLIILFVSIILKASVLPAQSIKHFLDIYNNTKEADTTRLKAIGDLAWGFSSQSPDSAILFAQLQLILAKQTNQKKYEARAMASFGRAYLSKGNYEKALDNFNRS